MKRQIYSMIYKPLLKHLPVLLIISVFVNLLSLAVPIFVLQVYNRVIFKGGMETLKALAIGVIIIIIFDFILRQSRARIIQKIALYADISLSQNLFKKLTRLPLEELESRPASYWQMIFQDANILRDSVAGSATLLLLDLPFIFLFIAVIAIVSTPVLWVILCLIPIFLFLAIIASFMVSNKSKKEQSAQLERDKLVAESIAGRSTVKALHLGPSLTKEWEALQASAIKSAIARGYKVDSFTNISMMLTMLATVAIVTVGALAIVSHKPTLSGQAMTIGGLIAANMLAGKIVQPLTQLVNIWRGFARQRTAQERLSKLFIANEEAEYSTIAPVNITPEIKVEDLSFAYQSQDKDTVPILQNISLSLKSGGLYGLIGANGAGKTTFLKLLQGLYKPQKGRILLDKADISQYGRSDMSSYIGYVPQDPFLFDGNILENITSGLKDIENLTDEKLLQATKIAGIDRWVSQLPDGYASEIGEGGRRFSTGQRQGIAIARAILAAPPILLLDEPTAHLDDESASNLRNTLLQLSKTHLIITTTHSRAMLNICHETILFVDGKLALKGATPKVIAQLQKNGAA